MDMNIVSGMLYSTALIPVALFVAFALLLLKTFAGKSLLCSKYPPIHGTVFGQLIYFNRLYDYMTKLVRRSPTFRLLEPDLSVIYTVDPDCFVERITDHVLDRMHYLHATLTETLRLYPAVPTDGRCAEKDDILPDGFHVKKGDCVYYLAYSMGRMQNIWGEDAEDFKPERWLNDGIFQNESPFKFVAFNAGPRICLGKDFAYRQMKIVSIALLHFFRFRLVDETRPVTYKVMLTLHINNGLHLRVVPRLAS